MSGNEWTLPTRRGLKGRRGRVLTVACSTGGASLQACALVLIFAACVESQRPTCHACGQWHHRKTPCELHAPGVSRNAFMSAVREFVRSQGVTDEDLAAIDVEMRT